MSPVIVIAFAWGWVAPAEPPAESVVRAMFDAFNRHDAEAMATLYADDARLLSSDFCSPRTGRADVLRTYRALFEAYPDIHDDIEDIVVQDDRVTVRFVARSGQGISAMALPITTWVIVRQGLIRLDESTFDTAGRPCSP
ncbi:nuclear transport factor 2 family protein [Dyella sp. C11]|uniref:nuclear transport factor 2 family protein n=1 Tax=Dyella sp. C11 TaxID=2126991 RepID=UPI000D64BC43|nr:nuclear transport factor 2 family protein [Dyella sp. C11]